ncbi:MAG: protein kinase [Myxococcota bacterium]
MAPPSSHEDSRYLRVREIAAGGMGRVDLAVRIEGRFHRLCAVKRMRAAAAADPSSRAMFLDEARFAGLLRHPNVVGVIDVGEDAEGPFLVMDYVEGLTLSEVLQTARKRSHLLPVQVALRIVRDVARGLAATHEATGPTGPLGLVHRDVSPQNVLLGFDGSARLADFGIATGEGRLEATATGVVKGKVGYLAPEVFRFEEATPKSDLYSLGIVLYEALTTTKFRPSKKAADLRRSLLGTPPDIDDVRTDVPPEVQALYFELLSGEPELRPRSADDVARRLTSAVEQMAVVEGSCSLEDYLAESFGSLRASQRQEVSEVLLTLSNERPRTSFPPHAGLHSGSSSDPTEPRRRRRGGIALGFILGAAFAVTGGVLLAMSSAESEAVTTDPEPSSSLTSTATAPSNVVLAAPELEPSAETRVPPPPPESPPTGDEPSPSNATEPAASTSRHPNKRANRPRPRPTMTKQRSAEPWAFPGNLGDR